IHDLPGSGRARSKSERDLRAQRRHAPRPTLSPDAAPAASTVWDELVRWISPRPVVRVDPDGTHTYARTHGVAYGEPQDMPYALHLTNDAHRYAHVVFDLDTSRDGLAGVWRDADTLTGMLAEAGLEH